MMNKNKHSKLDQAILIFGLSIGGTLLLVALGMILYDAWYWFESWWITQGSISFYSGYKGTRKLYSSKRKLKFWQVE